MNAMLNSTAVNNTLEFMKPALIILCLISAALILGSIVFTVLSAKAKNKLNIAKKVLLAMMYAATVVVLVCTVLCFCRYSTMKNALQGNPAVNSKTILAAETATESSMYFMGAISMALTGIR